MSGALRTEVWKMMVNDVEGCKFVLIAADVHSNVVGAQVIATSVLAGYRLARKRRRPLS
jgi:hypothetical protein